MCFAAIAYADINSTTPINTSLKPTSHSPSRLSFGDHPRDRDATTWDPIWTHAIRRANVPTVCRAACHTAHTLLMYSHSHLSAPALLTSNRVLLEIETFTKDLDVQGPAYPYDSVCVFLAQCLRVASQDVRLYRMQLEEKVLSWLVDCWKVGDVGGVYGRATDGGRMPLYTVRDILLILESICGLSKRSDLVCRLLLPECRIVDTLVEEGRTKVIRDFLLNAKLPTFRKPGKRGKIKLVGSMAGMATGAGTEEEMVTNIPIGANSVDLVQPRGRERKVSAFMLKFLETLVSEWEVIKEDKGHPTAEKARRSLDTAVIALCFESLLALNGTRSNRHVVQCACKLFALATARLTDARWTVAEKALVLLGLEPLTSTGEDERDGERWEAMLPPGMGTGIKTQTLRTLISDRESGHAHMTALRRDFQRIIWQSTDVSGSDDSWLLPFISANP
jgi:ataxia telangiectasia mutated family protein